MLSRTAKSPVRLNRGHSQTIFRAHLNGLKPLTTYYYRVTSSAADGIDDGEKSAIERFTAPGPDDGASRLIRSRSSGHRIGYSAASRSQEFSALFRA